VVVSQSVKDVDVFSLLKDGDTAYVNYLMVRNGTIVQTHTLQLSPHLDEGDGEVLSFGIARIREAFGSDATEIVTPIALDYPEPGTHITIPKSGDKKKLLDLSFKNVALFKDELKRKRMLNIEEKTEEQLLDILEELQSVLKLPEIPMHIECFDNSNFQGSYPVSAMVCFKNGAPSKNDYRRFNVKSVTGINDFATMKEAVYRRYKRLADDHEELPQLVIIDGGKGQLNAALEALKELNLTGQMTVVGLAKNIEEIFFPGDHESVKLDWQSEALKLVRRIRDEVHRFGITFHRLKRSKGTFKNELEAIPGIGKQTATSLLRHFKSVARIKAADAAALEAVIGVAKARLVSEYFAGAESDKKSG
jgi:excinuclease ABC subunit C